ncbi:MAG: serine/threonine protein kinase [Candidatus Eisenbacteria bacterium]|uniref:Serine/threonine protein kinase n=1 Tax=Eiseniibacteriota bacterium TaxID=2212470 RepID=A0A538TYY4_UNCEI|nr:MAG: serine/threonine protein kinase [Candidatus Eisenbacteria bacterium]
MDSRTDTLVAPRLLGRRGVRAEESRGSALATGLPPDLVRDAARRFGIIGLLCAAGNAMGLVVQETMRGLGVMPQHLRFERNATAVLGVALGLAAFGYARRTQSSPFKLIAAGLTFEVVAGYLLVFPEALQHVLLPQSGGMVRVSWLALWIAIYPVVLPASPPVAALAGLVTASMAPLAVWTVTALGHPWPPTSSLVYFFVPCYTVALLSIIPATLLHRMRREVTEARALGSYELVRHLGGGGMGEVWEASHRMLARPAAIKLIGAKVTAGATPAELEALQSRFEREAQATASLNSPHTVALYDFGLSEDGRFFYVMELLDGIDLERLVKEHGPLPPERAIHLLLAACDSLAEAHERGLVHRDIKPSNLNACRLGGHHDFLKVLDFGLVSAPRGASPLDTHLTRQEMAIGTPSTMAPEMVLGGPTDRRVDLYGLGCVAYWLVTGREVFQARSPVELMSHHAHTAPEPPSRHAPSPFPAELEAAILACLEKDPERRPADAAALAARLAAVPLASPWSEARAAAWWREHRPATAG